MLPILWCVMLMWYISLSAEMSLQESQGSFGNGIWLQMSGKVHLLMSDCCLANNAALMQSHRMSLIWETHWFLHVNWMHIEIKVGQDLSDMCSSSYT